MIKKYWLKVYKNGELSWATYLMKWSYLDELVSVWKKIMKPVLILFSLYVFVETQDCVNSTVSIFIPLSSVQLSCFLNWKIIFIVRFVNVKDIKK